MARLSSISRQAASDNASAAEQGRELVAALKGGQNATWRVLGMAADIDAIAAQK